MDLVGVGERELDEELTDVLCVDLLSVHRDQLRQRARIGERREDGLLHLRGGERVLVEDARDRSHVVGRSELEDRRAMTAAVEIAKHARRVGARRAALRQERQRTGDAMTRVAKEPRARERLLLLAGERLRDRRDERDLTERLRRRERVLGRRRILEGRAKERKEREAAVDHHPRKRPARPVLRGREAERHETLVDRSRREREILDRGRQGPLLPMGDKCLDRLRRQLSKRDAVPLDRVVVDALGHCLLALVVAPGRLGLDDDARRERRAMASGRRHVGNGLRELVRDLAPRKPPLRRRSRARHLGLDEQGEVGVVLRPHEREDALLVEPRRRHEPGRAPHVALRLVLRIERLEDPRSIDVRDELAPQVVVEGIVVERVGWLHPCEHGSGVLPGDLEDRCKIHPPVERGEELVPRLSVLLQEVLERGEVASGDPAGMNAEVTELHRVRERALVELSLFLSGQRTEREQEGRCPAKIGDVTIGLRIFRDRLLVAREDGRASGSVFRVLGDGEELAQTTERPDSDVRELVLEPGVAASQRLGETDGDDEEVRESLEEVLMKVGDEAAVLLERERDERGVLLRGPDARDRVEDALADEPLRPALGGREAPDARRP